MMNEFKLGDSRENDNWEYDSQSTIDTKEIEPTPHPDTMRLDWLIQELATCGLVQFQFRFPNQEIIELVRVHIDANEPRTALCEEYILGEAEYPNFRQAIDNAIQHKKGMKQSGWIAVTDRLPETTEAVLVAHNKYGLIRVSSFTGKTFDGERDDNPVTHWLPLPELTQGE